MKRAGKLAVFDVCDTLYSCNTTFEFVRYILDTTGARCGGVLVGALGQRWSPVFLLDAVLSRVTGREIGRRYAIHRLAGFTRAQLETFAEAFVAKRLPARANLPLHQALSGHLVSGDEVVLISNSLDIVVHAIANSLGVGAFASTVAFENGKCTGVTCEDIQGAKHQILDRLINNRDSYIVVYTDNLTDLALLGKADERYVVVPRGRSKHRWGEIDAAFIEL